jgi:hypothetical protein
VSATPPIRLRLALACLILIAASTVVGAAVVLGSGQDDPTTVATGPIGITGPPLVLTDGVEHNSSIAELDDTGMRLRVLDKDAAIRVERQARAEARRQAEAAAQQAAILEYAAALADARPAPAAVPDPVGEPPPADPVFTPPTAPPATGGGGGGGGLTLSERLDNIALCESGGNPQAYNPQGPWYGAWQFRRDTWDRMGGGPRDIRTYSYAQQKVVATRLAQSDGLDAWPTCAALLGYI